MSSPCAADLTAAYRAARRNWYRLYRTQDWVTDPEKRRRMLAARAAYQDAKLRLLLATVPGRAGGDDHCARRAAS